MSDLPLSEHVADTHAIIWHVDRDPKLSPTARDILPAAEAGKGRIFVSAISLVEMVYLADRGRLERTVVEQVLALVGAPNGSLGRHHAGADQGVQRAQAVPAVDPAGVRP